MVRPGIFSFAALCIVAPATLFCQGSQDPLLGGYLLGNSAEMVLMRIPADQAKLISTGYDFVPTLESSSDDSVDYVGSTNCFDVATADIDADGKEEACAVWRGEDGLARLSIGRSAGGNAALAEGVVTSIPIPLVISGLRVVRGTFLPDAKDELLVGYQTADQTIRLMVISVDSLTLVATIMGEIANEALSAALGSDALFDIAVGDFDRDGLDEIFLAKVYAATQSSFSAHAYLTMHLYNAVYDFDYGSRTIIPKGVRAFDVTRDVGSKPYMSYGQECLDVRTARIVATAGDYNNDGVEEPTVLWLSGMVFTWNATQFPIPSSRTYGEVLAQPLHISEDLDTLWFRTADLVSCELYVHESGLFEEAATTWGEWPLSAGSADLNGDGADELVTGGYLNIALFRADSVGKYSRTLSTPMPYPSSGILLGATSHRMLAIADVDPPDSMDTRWRPEIVVASTGLYLSGSAMRIAVYGIDVDTLTYQFKSLYGKFGQDIFETYYVGLCGFSEWAIALGDFNGDGVRLRNPRCLVRQNVMQPLVVLNGLPIHFDKLGDTCYDVSKTYGLNDGEFSATYEQQSGQTVQFSTQIKSDWGLSTSLTGGWKFLGLGVKTHFKSKYGEGFSKTNTSSQSVTVTQSAMTRDDDYLCVSIADYDYWEYQLFRSGVYKGNVVVVVPRLKNPPMRWVLAKTWEGMWYTPRHEVGNILSYSPPISLPAETDVDTLLYEFTPAQVSQKVGLNWEIKFDQFMSAAEERSRKLSFEAGASVSAWGWELGLEGTYSRDQLSTHTSTITSGVRVSLHVDEIDKGLGEVEYTIGPCVYWAQNGALVIDYSVDPGRSSGGGLETWWESRYGHNPDPAFNLPWRLDPEKGYALTNPAKRWLTKSIRVSPNVVNPGDQATIRVRVHNYSLLPLTRPVAVRLYAGDPDSGGVPIVGTGGLTQLMTVGTIAAQSYQNLQMGWTVPDGLSGITRIYGVIDPEDSVAEIHSDNNVGFSELTVLGSTGVREENGKGLPTHFDLYQNYPNPFNPSTIIRYSIPTRCRVVLRVYDILGREVETLFDGVQEVGYHNVWFNGSRYATGVYVYQLQAGSMTQSRKLLLLK